MHLDPILIRLAAVAFLLVAVGAVLRRLHQPSVIGYLGVGALVGPHGLALIDDVDAVGRLGSIGILLLLFFLGMEVPIPQLLARWRTLIAGTIVQVAASVGAVWLLGSSLGWAAGRIVLLGFVISLSSTAVVLAMLRESHELGDGIGALVTGVLLVQDLAVIPMLIIIGMFDGRPLDVGELVRQVIGAFGLMGVAYWGLTRGRGKLAVTRWVAGDRELELYAAFLACSALALVAGLLGLSAALGAFVAGVVVSALDDRRWIKARLELFHMLLVGAFFIGVGAQIDFRFVADNVAVIVGLVGGAVATNTVINALVFRVAKSSWGDALYGGALMSQIGEFSFVLAAVGLAQGIITPFAHQTTIAIIALSMLVTPGYVALMRRLRARAAADGQAASDSSAPA